MMSGIVITESDKPIVIENNLYFPPDSINRESLSKSGHRSTCPWKGEAHYHDVTVAGEKSKNAAWSYPKSKDAASEIIGYMASWKRVEIID